MLNMWAFIFFGSLKLFGLATNGVPYLYPRVFRAL